MKYLEARALLAKPKKRKYGNEPTIIGTERFDSKGEGARYAELQFLQRGGEIRDLVRQVTYKLKVNGKLIGSVRPDFRYVEVEEGWTVCEDFKGAPPAASWRVRWKLAAALFPDIVWRTTGTINEST